MLYERFAKFASYTFGPRFLSLSLSLSLWVPGSLGPLVLGFLGPWPPGSSLSLPLWPWAPGPLWVPGSLGPLVLGAWAPGPSGSLELRSCRPPRSRLFLVVFAVFGGRVCVGSGSVFAGLVACVFGGGWCAGAWFWLALGLSCPGALALVFRLPPLLLTRLACLELCSSISTSLCSENVSSSACRLLVGLKHRLCWSFILSLRSS